MQCYQSISWSETVQKKYWFAYMWECTWTLSGPRYNCYIDFACFRGHFEPRNWPFVVIFRLGTTRHSISHARKWLKQMWNQNGTDSYRGSTFSQIGHRLTLCTRLCASACLRASQRTFNQFMNIIPKCGLSNTFVLRKYCDYEIRIV
jgi:hypothetical protein